MTEGSKASTCPHQNQNRMLSAILAKSLKWDFSRRADVASRRNEVNSRYRSTVFVVSIIALNLCVLCDFARDLEQAHMRLVGLRSKTSLALTCRCSLQQTAKNQTCHQDHWATGMHSGTCAPPGAKIAAETMTARQSIPPGADVSATPHMRQSRRFGCTAAVLPLPRRNRVDVKPA